MAIDHGTVRRLFEEVVGLPPAEHAAWLDEHCPDPAVRAEVEALLGHHRAGSTAMFSAVRGQVEALGDADEPLAPFERVAEFRILRKIGRGGMAVVYLAEDTSLARLVALKILPRRSAGDATLVARFMREARAVARVKHSNVVEIYRVDRHGELPYFAMEFVDGGSLHDRVEALRAMPADDQRRLIRSDDHLRGQVGLIAQVADALAHVHVRGIVHRDVKPSNILVTLDGAAKLADFGIVQDELADRLTHTHQLPGTYHYMSPEQATAAQLRIDGRSDVFSLGVVLYESVTGVLPFQGRSSVEIVQQVVNRRPVQPRALNPAVARDLETIVNKAMEKDPLHRYQSAGHFAADLRCFLDGRPILARPPSLTRKLRVWARDHRVAALAGTLVVLLGVIVALVAYADAQRRGRLCAISLVPAAGESVADALVSVQRFDPRTHWLGPSRPLGRFPLDGARLAPGQYRFTVVAGPGRFHELTVYLDAPGTRTVIDDVRIPVHDDDLRADMILVPAGTYTIGSGRTGARNEDRTETLDAFYLDRYEVTNRRYKAFVDATGHPAPESWVDGYPEALADHPVVGVAWRDAQRYARWAGKRLPTWYEWEAAMRAPGGALTFAGADPSPPGLTVDEIHAAWYGDLRQKQREYAKWSRPVDAQRDTAMGFHGAFGNVRELTDSICFGATDAVFLKGPAWTDVPEFWTFARNMTYPIPDGDVLIGFRCALSADWRGR